MLGYFKLPTSALKPALRTHRTLKYGSLALLGLALNWPNFKQPNAGGQG